MITKQVRFANRPPIVSDVTAMLNDASTTVKIDSDKSCHHGYLLFHRP
jgi:hypothetical protein